MDADHAIISPDPRGGAKGNAMKRNTLFGGLALLLAGGVIGAGAMVSSSAMADTPGADAPTNQLTMVKMDQGGEAIRCSFTGTDVAAMLPVAPSGAPDGGSGVHTIVTGSAIASGPNVVVSGGAVLPADGSVPVLDPKNLPAGAQVIHGSISVAGGVPGESGAVGTGEGQILTASPAADLPVLVSDADARDGTAQECAAMHDEAVKMAATQPTGAVVIDATVATKP
jgi:hypothetical protein